MHIYIYYNKMAAGISYLHDWDGNMGKYSVSDRPISQTEGRDDTKVENGIFPRITRLKELQ